MKHMLKAILIALTILNGLFASEIAPNKEEVARLYVATFNRAPDDAGLQYWVYSSNLTLSQIAQSFFDQPETQQLYPETTSNHDFIKSVYQNLFNRDPDEQGWIYWENELNLNHFSKNMFIIAVINGALAPTGSTDDAQILSNKTTVGLEFASKGLSDKEKAKSVMKDIDSTDESVAKAINDIETFANKPKVISTLYSVGYIKTIAQKDDILFLGSGPFEPNDGKLYIVDVSNKTNPRLVSTLKMPDANIEDIMINSNNKSQLIVANNQKLIFVDISNVNSPSIIKTIVPRGYARELAIKGDILYVASGYGDIVMYSLNTYEQLEYIEVDGDYTDSIAIKGDYIFTSDSYSKYITVSSITSKNKATVIEKTDSLYAAKRDMAIYADKLYVAEWNNLSIYNISSISNIYRVAQIATPKIEHKVANAVSVTLSTDGTKAYVSNKSGGLAIYDISNSSKPTLIKSALPKGEGVGYSEAVISTNQDYAYAIGSKGLEIIKLNIQSSSITSNYMDISKWKIYGTASMRNNLFTIGDNIGYDENDVDNDQNLWQRYADNTLNNDYDVVVTKDKFTPPIDLKFSGTISTTNYGYNEMGIGYQNDSFDAVFGHGRPLSPIATFVYSWESGDTLNLFVSGQGYISTSLSSLTGDFELKWDGSIVKFYYNNQLISQKPLSYIQGKNVSIFFKNFEKPFNLDSLYISGTKSSTQSDTTTIGNTVWVNKEPDGEFDYLQAKVYCENLGYRLPTASELVAAWNFYGGIQSPPGFKKGTFYWGSQGEWCAMDYDCSTAEIGPLDGYGHPKCVIK